MYSETKDKGPFKKGNRKRFPKMDRKVSILAINYSENYAIV